MHRSVNLQHWHDLANQEAKENRKRSQQHGKGICSVFLLDTSASMAGEGFDQMKEAFKDIINELSAHPQIDENVAVITFGKEVKFLHYYSNNYASLRQSLAAVNCSGSSPMEAGIILALSCLVYGGGHTAVFEHNINVRARLIIISDGWPSTSANIGGPEVDSTSKESLYDGTVARLQSLIKAVGKTNPIVCIPVGPDPNIAFLESLMCISRGGRLVNHKNARQCGRFDLNMNMAAHVLDKKAASQITREDIQRIARLSTVESFTVHDLEDVYDIIKCLDVYKPITAEDLDPDDNVYTERYANVPRIGTRVKRGLHWTWKNQDSDGPGTVVGHSLKFGWVIVEWDNGLRLSYQYGFDGLIEKYDIATCKEPRILENELIAVGCLVTRGPDWKWGNQDGGEGNIGTVYRVKQEAVVYVKWPNGNRCNYRYGYENKYDVQLCDPFEPSTQSGNSQRRLNDSESHREETRGSEWMFSSARDGDDHLQSHRETEYISKSNEINGSLEYKSSYERHEGNSSYRQAVNRRWQWKDSSGRWNDYSEKINEKIEKSYKRKPESSVVINLEGRLCRISFQKRKQIDTISKTITDVRSNEDD